MDRNSKNKICAALICGAFLIGALGGLGIGPREADRMMEGAEAQAKTTAVSQPEISPPSVSASSSVLIDENGEVLYEKNADEARNPASVTKIMTLLLIFDALHSGKIHLQDEVVGIEGSSIYLKKGERLTIEELLYGLMLRSGNDSAAALAACMGGSLGEFVSMMNERAAALGCSGTHFTNPSGLYEENHYTTASDLAKIAYEAMKREDFREIVRAKDWQSEDGSRSFHNKNKTVFQYEGATGIKIGFTKASGRTLVASAERDGRQMIAVVLRDGNWFNDAYALMDYGFEQGGK